eukprot:PITA_25534
MRNLKENGHQNKEYLKKNVRKKMQFLTRDSIQLKKDMESSKLEAVVENHCSVGYVLKGAVVFSKIDLRSGYHQVRIKEEDIFKTPFKTSFFQTKVHYLGHVVPNEGIAVDLEKIRAIMEWATSKNVDEMRLFVGLASYYKRFIRNFSHITYPITSLQWKGKKFEWTKECEVSFEQLKQLLAHVSMLKIVDLGKEFAVCIDAFKRGLDGILMQEG